MEAEKLLNLVIAQNVDLHQSLRRVFRNKAKGRGKLRTVEFNWFLKSIKSRKCHINYRFGNIPKHVPRSNQGRISWRAHLVENLSRTVNEWRSLWTWLDLLSLKRITGKCHVGRGDTILWHWSPKMVRVNLYQAKFASVVIARRLPNMTLE